MSGIDTLIDQLASDGAAAKTGHMGRFSAVLLTSIVLCAAILLAMYGAPFRGLSVAGFAPYLAKWSYSLALVILAVLSLYTIGKPGAPTGKKLALLALPFAAVGVLAVMELASGKTLEMGETWGRCLTSMALLSPIAFGCAILAVRQLAPVNLRAGGLAAGLFGGGIAASIYTPYCPEQGVLYLLIFYCGPTFIMAAIGWLSGPKLLRW